MSAMHYQRDSLPADAAGARAARKQLRGWLDTAGVEPAPAAAMVAAVSEALDNTVRHAYHYQLHTSGRVELTMLVDQREILVCVADVGPWRQPPTTALEHDVVGHPAEHGRGITLMAAHVDDVAIQHGPRGTRVLLRLDRTRRPASPSSPMTDQDPSD